MGPQYNAFGPSWKYTTASILMGSGTLVGAVGSIVFLSGLGVAIGIALIAIGCHIDPPQLSSVPFDGAWSKRS